MQNIFEQHMVLLHGQYQWWLLNLNDNRIAQNFNGGNFDVFDAFQLDRQNLTCQVV